MSWPMPKLVVIQAPSSTRHPTPREDRRAQRADARAERCHHRAQHHAQQPGIGPERVVTADGQRRGVIRDVSRSDHGGVAGVGRAVSAALASDRVSTVAIRTCARPDEGTQRRVGIEHHLHRHALDDLGEGAGGIVGRQQGEGRAGTGHQPATRPVSTSSGKASTVTRAASPRRRLVIWVPQQFAGPKGSASVPP